MCFSKGLTILKLTRIFQTHLMLFPYSVSLMPNTPTDPPIITGFASLPAISKISSQQEVTTITLAVECCTYFVTCNVDANVNLLFVGTTLVDNERFDSS